MFEHTLTITVISYSAIQGRQANETGEMNAMRNLALGLILGCFTAGAIILTFLVRLAIRSHRSGVETSTSRMIGSKGKAVSDVAPEGRVSVQGEYWWAYSRAKIGEGENVRVIGIDGLTIEVEPCPDKSVLPRPVSVIDQRDVH
jgi:membrane-bound ClpP family serine protease